MKITYTGRQVELAPAQLKKIEAEFEKVSKLLEGRGEKEAHVVLSLERHLHHAEITVDYYDHRMVGIGSGPDVYTAMHAAIDKLEKQVVKVRERWRDAKRTPHKGTEVAEQEPAGAEAAGETGEPEESTPQVFPVNSHTKSKPMTLDEAVIEMEKDRDYLVYRDAQTDRLAILVRRRDGNFDLIEA
jgi:putative sigma-54 modulation protein